MTDDVAPLRRRFGPEDLEPLLREHGVTGTVVVQARQSLDETRDLLAIAASTPFVLGVVGWVDLTGDVAAQLAEFEDAPLVGIRHLVHDEADPEWLLRDDVQRGLSAVGEAGLVYDLLVRVRELPAAIETARRHSGMRFVLDHVAKRAGRRVRAAHVGTRRRRALRMRECRVQDLGSLHGGRAGGNGRTRASLVRAGALHVGLRLAGDLARGRIRRRPRARRRRSARPRRDGDRDLRAPGGVSRVDLGPERVGRTGTSSSRDVFLDLGGRPRADDDRLDRGMAQRELQRRRGDGNIVRCAHRLERAPPHEDLVRRVLVVAELPGAVDRRLGLGAETGSKSPPSGAVPSPTFDRTARPVI